MLRNYFRSNLRMLWKNRGQSVINILGLAMGIICTIVIFLTVKFELSFDRNHPDSERTYRVVTEYNNEGKVGHNAGITYVLPDAMRNDFPDLELVTVTDANLGTPVIGVHQRDGSKSLFKEPKFAFVDPDYFKIFNYTWIEGNPDDATAREKTIVITRSVAKKYFGDAPALGQVINFNARYDLTVTGVVEDPPLNSDFPFKLLVTNKLGADKHSWDNWGSTSSSINCYVRLRPNVDPAALQKKMDGWHKKYFTGDEKEDGEHRRYFLQPLSEVHFDTRFGNYGDRVVSHQTLLALSLIGVLLFITACINFVNLNTVLIINRAKEVGVRKVLGGGRFHLVMQFMGETFLVTMIAMVISLGAMEFVMMYLRPVLGYPLEFHPVQDKQVLLFIIVLPLAVTLLAGLYPALSLAQFQPIKALKSKIYGASGDGAMLRRALISFQLIISQALVISTIVIIQQLDLFMNQPLGVDSSAVVEFEIPVREKIDFTSLKGRMLSIAGVQGMTMSNTGSVASNTWSGGFEAKINNQIVKGSSDVKFADEDFVKTYGLKLIAGKDLIKSDSATMFVVTEAFYKELGIKSPEDAIGTYVDYWGRKALIQGVVKNFNASSLHNEISPVIIMEGHNSYFVGAIRLDTKDVKGVMSKVEAVWKEFFPNHVFEYTFLDDTINHFYDSERRTSKLVSIFAVVAILIGSMGLLGLVSFMVTRRTKEVGIRKALGASVASIMTLFSKEFVILIGISFVVAAPAAYYVMNQWLQNFAYRVELGPFTFVVGMVLSLVVVMMTVGYISYKAAVANPVIALKDE